MSKVFALSVVGGQITALKGKLETVQNCTITTDKWGNNKAIEFTGNSYIKPVDDSLRNFGTDTDFTISLWAKYNGVGGGYDEFLGHPADFTQIMARSDSQPLPYVTFANNSSSYKVVGGAESISTTDWHHIAAVRSGTTAIFFLDGVGVKSDISNYAFNIENVYIGWDGRQSNTWFKGIISDFVILKDEAKWTEDFTPPTSPLLGNKQLYLTKAGLVYGTSDNTFSKLSDNWSALTDTEKVSLFTATKGEVPTVEELKTIGTKFKVLVYSENEEQQTCTVLATPKELPDLEVKESYAQEDVVSTNVSDTVGLRPVLCVPDPKETVITAPKCELTLKSKPTYTKPGEAFSFEYTVKTAGTLGTFSAPGEAIKPDLFDGPGTTPDGTAYFVNVGTEYNGAMKFVCDRNIQGGISWETLNTAGMCVTSGMDVSDFTGIQGSRMRLMESSVVNPDMDKRNSEWDEIIFQDYIPNSDVPTSKINDWNYTKTRSWMLNTPSQDDVAGNACDMGARVVRGCEDRWYTTVGKRFLPSTDTYDTVCLRPVLTIPTDQQSVLADSVVTPTRTLKKDVLVETDFIFLNEEATLENTTIEYYINKVALFNGDGQDNTLKPTSQHLTQTIPLDRLDFGENEVMLQIRSAGLTNNIVFKVYREKIGDTSRTRDFLNYTGGHTLTNLAVRNNTVVSAAQSNEHENVTELKLPDNIVSIKLED